MMQKTVNAKAKADLRSNILVWDANSRCPKGYWFFKITASKMQTQKIMPRNYALKKSKPKIWSQFCHVQMQQNFWSKEKKIRKSKSADLVITDKTIRESKKKLWLLALLSWRPVYRKIPDILYYNYDKKSHYFKYCLNSPKN